MSANSGRGLGRAPFVSSKGVVMSTYVEICETVPSGRYLLRGSSVERAATAQLPTHYGKAVMVGYRGTRDEGEHLALIFGSPELELAPLVRIHSECFTGDVFGSLRCDCGPQLDAALRRIADNGSGIIIYLRQEGRGIGLLNKLKAYALQEEGLDTVDANRALGFADDLRDYRIGADMLADLGIDSVRLLSNNPDKVRGLEQWGVRVAKRHPLVIAPVSENVDYIRAKEQKMGHLYHVSNDLEIIPTQIDVDKVG